MEVLRGTVNLTIGSDREQNIDVMFRYLAFKYGAHVCAVEIETGRHQLAQSLTDRCHLSSHVTHVLGDASTVDVTQQGPFDHFVSWLSILHIKNRKRLFDNIAAHLKQG